VTQEKPPLERFFDLDRLGQAGADVAIALKGDDLAQLAKWAKVESVQNFHADVALKRLSQTRFKLDYSLAADLTQACVVTLEPVPSHIERAFSRELHVTSHAPPEKGGALALDAGDDEVPEEIASPHFDLAGPLLEEFVLAIDPYPRAEGASFEAPSEGDDDAGNPFAVLKSLKKGS
jgi:uncharacterized metal-binding protein YceD (DUF177 family)